ncbi:MAG TPA: glycosyltransferase family 2 protein [Candidatus Binataceae bacterium]|nr:glycosyltransferase family 2 protein [Candidatus Binataceae bacterium]
MPAVSVIIPAYNRRAMLKEAIASVAAQRGANFELIVVDDGSDDGTWEDLNEGELAAALAQAPSGCAVKLLRQENRGPAAARNHGAAVATGEYLAFLDSDDLWMPDKLARQLAYFANHPHLRIAQTQELWLREGRPVNPGRRHRKPEGQFFVAALRTCLISPSAVMMRADLFTALAGFDPRLAACEDYDLWLRVLIKHPVGLLDAPLVIRRAGPHGQLSALTPALDRFRIRSLLKLLAAGDLDAAMQRQTALVLRQKCGIYAQGLERRRHERQADFYRGLAGQIAIQLEHNLTLDRNLVAGLLRAQPLECPDDV